LQTIESEVVNGYLRGGTKVPLKEDPLFKLVWSNDEYELRTAKCAKFDAHNNFIGWEYKTDRLRKYSWIDQRWVLEQWRPPEVAYNSELPESINGSYEPLYVFQDERYNSLPLRLDVIQFIVKCALAPEKSEQLRKSISLEARENKDKKAMKESLEVLEDEGPLVSQFHDGSAILRP
jgi:hypothetical protein